MHAGRLVSGAQSQKDESSGDLKAVVAKMKSDEYGSRDPDVSKWDTQNDTSPVSLLPTLLR